MLPDAKQWFVFLWAAAFSGVAILLRVARDLTNRKPHKLSTRDVIRAILDVITVSFFGGLAGWGMALLFPALTQESPTVMAIGAAVMAYSGLNASQGVLYRMFSVLTGTTILLREEDGGQRKSDGKS